MFIGIRTRGGDEIGRRYTVGVIGGKYSILQMRDT